MKCYCHTESSAVVKMWRELGAKQTDCSPRSPVCILHFQSGSTTDQISSFPLVRYPLIINSESVLHSMYLRNALF